MARHKFKIFCPERSWARSPRFRAATRSDADATLLSGASHQPRETKPGRSPMIVDGNPRGPPTRLSGLLARRVACWRG